jgi:glutathione S-transferase
MMTLYYLPMRARAEPIRMVLHYAGIPYNESQITFSQWPTFKNTLSICPFGQLPTLQLPSGEILAESGSILRYVAKLGGLYPQDPWQAAQSDMVHELAQDMNAINALLNFWPTLTDTYAQNKDNYFKNFPRYAGYATKLLGNNAFFVGDAPAYGDFSMFHILDIATAVEPRCMDGFPELQQWMSRMCQLPGLREYLEVHKRQGDLGMCGTLIQTLVPMSISHK